MSGRSELGKSAGRVRGVPAVWTAMAAAAVVGSAWVGARAADEEGGKAPKTTFKEASAVFQARCNSCHNSDKQKGGLALDSYLSAMQGGGSGTVIEPGDPDASTLYLLITHQEEPKMPPSAPRIPDEEIAVIKRWIEAGAPENEGSATAAPKKKTFEFKVDPSQVGKPNGPPAMPEGVRTEPELLSKRANPALAIAHSPWAPLAAIAGHKQIFLYKTDGARRLVGVLPFPEGAIHTLKFSRNGELLIAGGGRGGQSGLAVVWNVKTGERIFEIGKEYDIVLAADISPDQSLVALGGPSKVVRVYNTSDGELAYELRKHTEWITALEFSPDGVLLASGDRNQGLLVWESLTGREFFDLRGHNSSITDVSWRLDSNVLASASEDGTVKLWEMNNGTAIKSFNAHGGGTRSARFSADGRIVTTGRDRVARVWDGNGNKLKDFEAFPDLALQAAFTHDGKGVVAGDFSGQLRIYEIESGARIAELSGTPEPVAVRLEKAAARLAEERARFQAAEAELEPARQALAEASAAAEATAKSVAEREAIAQSANAKLEGARKTGEAAEVELVAARAEMSLMTEALAKLEAERDGVQARIAEATARLNAGTESLAKAREAFEAAMKAKAEADARVNAVAERVRAAGSLDDMNVASLDLARETLLTVEKSTALANLAREQSELRMELARLEAEREAMGTILAGFPARLDEAKGQIEKAAKTVASKTEARDAALKLVAEAEAEATAATAEVARVKGEAEKALAVKAEAEKTVAEKSAALEPSRLLVEDLAADVEAMTAELKARAAAAAAAAAAAVSPPRSEGEAEANGERDTEGVGAARTTAANGGSGESS